jgi:Na+-translocating ferredoxin:NAD+ oxidoreductase RNF subunit RnfB
MLLNILQAGCILGALGAILAFIVWFVARKFAIKVSPMLEEVLEKLPGANCGACGFAGCSGFAQAVVEGEAEPAACIPGGVETAQEVGKILGVEVKLREKRIAKVACSGRCEEKKYLYQDVKDCRVILSYFGGDSQCEYSCLGLGSCSLVCPFEAISVNIDQRKIEISEARCSGCGKCESACPRQVIKLVPLNKPYIMCSSQAKGGVVRKICPQGCIGCGRCVKVCQEGAIKVENNLAVFNYEKCTACGKCIEKCPTQVIKL